MQIKKSDGTIEVFDDKKLSRALTKAGANYMVAKEITDHIVDKCSQPGHEQIVKSELIYRLAFKQLKNISRRSALKFSLKKAMLELGPSGFPFEEFIAEMWRARGYTAITGQIVFGTCVAHEVDVIAWKEDELVMIEAKYHSDSGSRTDLKTALYVKARYDDIKLQTFSTTSFNLNTIVDSSLKDMHMFEKDAQHLDPKTIKMPKQLTEGWLVTNTHFSDTAMNYADCNGLKIMSYDCPDGGSLQDIVMEHKLFPITCLTVLSTTEKKDLIGRNIVLCKTLHEKEHVLHDMGFSKDKIYKVLEEVSTLL
ncbi:MAG: ATP cone domain-containing protein [Patescibacteria group bacterium]